MKCKIERTEGGLLHIEEADVVEARSVTRDPEGNTVEITLKRRSSYLQQPGFQFHGGVSKTCSIRLNARQVKDLCEQDASQQEVFCDPCYWHGKSPEPDDCVRC